MELNLAGKTVLVTASSAGIGRATAELFIKEGCKVAICSSNKDNLIKTVNEIKQQFNIDPFWGVCDINKSTDIENIFNMVKNEFGDIDILVNNCGGPKAGFFEDLNDETWQSAFDQVLMSAIRFTRLVLPAMKEKKWGRIINITSLNIDKIDYNYNIVTEIGKFKSENILVMQQEGKNGTQKIQPCRNTGTRKN